MAIPSDIIPKKINTIQTDHFSVALVSDENDGMITETINQILEHLRNLSLPIQDIDETQIIQAIENMKLERLIPLSLQDGVTINYDDGETCTRVGNKYIISHPRDTVSAFWKLVDASNEVVAFADIQPLGNQIILEFMVAIDEDLKLIIL